MYMNKSEAQFLLSHMDNTKKVLEYGSGESTAHISKLVKTLVSIEHDKTWYNKVNTNIQENVKLILKEPAWEYIPSDFQDAKQFKDYIEYPLQEIGDGLFDIVFIDGVCRVQCASMCSKILKPDGIVFIHDYDISVPCRKQYTNVLEYFEKIDSCLTMAKFKLK